MAFRTWGRVLLVALGVGVLAGAGQLGFAYGFGIVRFARTFDSTTASHWTAQLTWVSWFTMVAAVVGAVIADRLARRYDYRPTLATRSALAAAAALGAGAVAPLSMQPARAAEVASVDPVLATGLVATLGAVVGLAAALAALNWSPISWNIALLTGGIWLLALISVMPSLGPTDPLPAVRLGVPDPAWLGAGTTQRLAVVTMAALALVAGALSGALARFRGHPTAVVASTGAVGPALLALAYLSAGPGGSTDKYQAAPYWGALVAVGAGAIGSVLAAVMRWPLTGETAKPSPLEPTEILRRVRDERPARDAEPTEAHSAPPPTTRTERPTDSWATHPTETWTGPPASGAAGDQPLDQPTTVAEQRRSSEQTTGATGPAFPTGADTRAVPPSTDTWSTSDAWAASDVSAPPAWLSEQTTSRPVTDRPTVAPPAPVTPTVTTPSAVAPSTTPRSPATSSDRQAPPVRPGTATTGSDSVPAGPVESPTPFRLPATDPLPPTADPVPPTSDPVQPIRPAADPIPPVTDPNRTATSPGADPMAPAARPARRPEPEWADPTLATLATGDYWPSTVDPRTPFEERTESGWDAFAAGSRTSSGRAEPATTPDHPRPTGRDVDADREAARTTPPRPVTSAEPFATPEPVSTAKPFRTPEPVGTGKRVTPPEPVSTPRRVTPTDPAPTTSSRVTPPDPAVPKAALTPERATTQIPTPERATSTESPAPEPATDTSRFASPEPATGITRERTARPFGVPAQPSRATRPEQLSRAQPEQPSRSTEPGGASGWTVERERSATEGAYRVPEQASRAQDRNQNPPAVSTETSPELSSEVSPASAPDSAPETKSARPRRGLFRRNRAASGGTESEPAAATDTNRAEPPAQREPRGRGRTERPVPETDEEYVDWVSGLGASSPGDDTPHDDTPRRTLRSSGRHHAD